MPASWLLTVPLAVVLGVPAVTALIAGLRGRAGTLSRTGRLGIHGPASHGSDEAFRLANRVGAPVALAAAAVLGIGAVLTLALRLPTLATLVIFVLSLAGGIGLLIAAGTLGERAAATVPRQAARPVGCGDCVCGSGGCAGLTRTADAPSA